MFHVYRSLIFILCSLLCLPSCIRDDSPSGAEGVRPGDRLPDFTVSLNDNTLVVASDLLGKVAVLVFFHTECPDCQKEFPVVQRLYDYYRDNSTVKYIVSAEKNLLTKLLHIGRKTDLLYLILLSRAGRYITCFLNEVSLEFTCRTSTLWYIQSIPIIRLLHSNS